MPAALGLLLWLSLAGALRPGLEPPQYDSTEQGAAQFAGSYNNTAEIVFFDSVSASWNYNTDLTPENAALQVGGGTGAMPPRGCPQYRGLGGLGHGGGTWCGSLPPCGLLFCTSGWQTRAGTCSPRAAGFCPKLVFRETLPQNDSSGPRAESRLFLEVIPFSQHLPLSFSPSQNWARCQLPLSSSLPGVTTSQC